MTVRTSRPDLTSIDRHARKRALERLSARALDYLPLLLASYALLLVGSLLRILATRLTYPIDLEWIEGGQLLHAYRVLHGQELFTPPNVGFMPYSYPPGHTLVLTVFGAVLGVDYWVGRLVSWLAFAGIVYILLRQVFLSFSKIELKSAAALLGAGMIAAAFPITGGWFDLVRNDELALFWSVLAGALAFNPSSMSRGRYIGTLLVMNTAVFTKQTAVFYLTWILLFHLARNPRQALKLAAGLATLGALTTGLLEWITQGRYLEYTVYLLAKQMVHKQMYADAWQRWLDFAPYLPAIPAIAGVLALFRLLQSRTVFWLGMLAVAFPASMLPYAKQGGYINNLLPVAVLGGPSILMLLGSLGSAWPRRAWRTHGAVHVLVFGLGAAYLRTKAIDETKFAVSAERRAGAEGLLRTIAGLGPSVWIPHYPFVAVKAGSVVEQVHEMPWVDAWLAGVQGLSLKPYVERTRPKYVVLTGLEVPLVIDALAGEYYLARRVPDAEQIAPITGFPATPKYILARNDKAQLQNCLFEFESSLANWKQEGNAFRSALRARDTSGRNLLGRRGQSLLSSSSFGDVARGKLVSPEFVVDHPKLTARVGGGSSSRLSVRLRVDGRVVAESRGGAPEMLERVEWNVSPYLGESAQIEVVDEDTQAHVLVDDICWASDAD
jgi:hypothetical protein